ncbi:MAG: hypothetical protein BWK80_47375 [Desulfobacteraceae bacterium IS3]|nr:MAG: hypothetical protein BWK80_47375 [Desulfobacteraceae bacterium IS3]
MNQIFPYANVVAGVLVLLVGFVFHWIGQLISVLSWNLAMRIGLQEKAAPAEYRVYEHGDAVADVLIGWIYGIAGVGLLLGTQWGFKLAWLPGAVLFYHSVGFWFTTRNQRNAGHFLYTDALRVTWFLANSLTGVLTVLVAWNGC